MNDHIDFLFFRTTKLKQFDSNFKHDEYLFGIPIKC